MTVAKLWGRTYAFIGLERIGGVMIYDVSDPYNPAYVQYLNNRDFSAQPGTPEAGDLGAEGVPRGDSPKKADLDLSPFPGKGDSPHSGTVPGQGLSNSKLATTLAVTRIRPGW